MCSVGNTTPESRLRFFCSGFSRSTAVLVASCSAWPSTVSTRFSIDEILRSKFEALGVGALPGGRAQIAGRFLAFAGIELGDLAEFQRIALAGTAAEIVDDAAADAGNLRVAAGLPERKVVNRPMRHEYDGRVRRSGPRRRVLRLHRHDKRQDKQASATAAARNGTMSSTTMNLSRSTRFGDGPPPAVSPSLMSFLP